MMSTVATLPKSVNDQSAQAAVSTSRTSTTPSASSSTTPCTRFNYGNPLNFMMGGGGLGNTYFFVVGHRFKFEAPAKIDIQR